MRPVIHLLLLDFDGVCARYSRPVRVARLADVAGCAPERVEQVLFGSGLEQRYDAGEIDTADYLQRLGQGLGSSIGKADWLDARVAACESDPRVLAMVEQVAARLPIAILTNNGALMAQAALRIVPTLAPLLHGRLLCSGELGVCKPQLPVYQAALQRLGAQPSTTLFLDDLFVNVRGARAAGLHAETVNGAPSMRRVLRRFGLL
jgi:glucose-1-phosphatase